MSTVINRDAVKRNISTNVRRLMEARGMTQADLHRTSGLTEMYVSRIVRGVMDPSSSGLASLAEALQVTTDELLSDPKKRRQPA